MTGGVRPDQPYIAADAVGAGEACEYIAAIFSLLNRGSLVRTPASKSPVPLLRSVFICLDEPGIRVAHAE